MSQGNERERTKLRMRNAHVLHDMDFELWCRAFGDKSNDKASDRKRQRVLVYTLDGRGLLFGQEVGIRFGTSFVTELCLCVPVSVRQGHSSAGVHFSRCGGAVRACLCVIVRRVNSLVITRSWLRDMGGLEWITGAWASQPVRSFHVDFLVDSLGGRG